MSKVLDLITAESILQWIIIAAIVVALVYRGFPEFYRRITSGAKKEQKMEFESAETGKRLEEIEGRLDDIDRKLSTDFNTLRQLSQNDERNRKILRNSLEEREIIMRALLGIIGGLQEIGADGPTKDAQTEITDYLAKQAHRDDDMG